MESTVEDLISTVKRLDTSTLRQGAAEIRAQSDDLGWLRATVAIDRALRRQCRSVEAAGAARAASDAVAAAATTSGLLPDDPDVACVSRRAAEIARGLLVAGTVLPHLAWLLQGWQGTIAFRLPGPETAPAPRSWWDGWWARRTGA